MISNVILFQRPIHRCRVSPGRFDVEPWAFVHKRAGQHTCIQAVGNHAIIAGGSIAGLLAAKVIAPYCDRVIIVDRDELRDLPKFTEISFQEISDLRKGVAQMLQPHQLSAGGLAALEHILPGFRDAVIKLGGEIIDLGREVYYYDYGNEFPRTKSGVEGLSLSRRLVEQVVRDHVYERLGSKLSIMRGKVINLEIHKGTIKSAVLYGGDTIPCNIFIDAMGRSSQLPKILQSNGYQKPRTLIVDGHVTSASKFVQMPPDWDKEWKLLIMKSLDGKGGGLLPMENNMWQVTLAEYGGKRAPIDEEGFLEFAKELPDPIMYQTLKRCKPVTEGRRYPAWRNEKICYHEIELPGGIFLLGDSVQRLNPVYGQGIALVAKGALSLQNTFQLYCQSEVRGEVARIATQDHQLRLAKVLEGPWRSTIFADLRYPCTETKGIQAPSQFAKSITISLLKRAQNDPYLYLKLIKVAHLVAPSSTLYMDMLLSFALDSLAKFTRKPLERT